MGRYAQIVGSATDVYGLEWDVRERRATKHGWHVHVGWPSDEPRGRGCGGVRVILTIELATYLMSARPRDIDLPMGRTTAKRLRSELGVRWNWDSWWSARAEDLRSMTLERFCDRHGCSIGAASQRRAQLRDSDNQS